MESQKRDALCAALEKEYVHDVYNKTAHHFVDVKYKAWPRVKEFLLGLDPGSLVADIGCGSGKYLAINKGILTLGCDHSNNLVHVAGQQGHHVLSCDNLSLPFRDNCFDAVISIGVIHHFTTPSRRAKAIQELARVLRPGGRVMIYVWAMEQKHRKFKAQDVLVPWHLKTKQRKQGKSRHEHDSRSVDSTSRDLRNPVNKPPHMVLNASNICPYTYNGSIDAPRVTSRSNRTRSVGSHKSNIKTSQRSDGSKSDHLTGESKLENETCHKDLRNTSTSTCSSEERDLKKPFWIQKKGTVPIVSDVKPKIAKDSNVRKDVQNCSEVSATEEKKDLLKFERKDSLPNMIKTKFLSLIGIDSTDVLAQEFTHKQSEKDLKYKELIENIVREDSQFFVHSHTGKVIPSVLAMEGFAVREFPQSSRSGVPVNESGETTVKCGWKGPVTGVCESSRDGGCQSTPASDQDFGRIANRNIHNTDTEHNETGDKGYQGHGRVVFTLGDFGDSVLEQDLGNGTEFESFRQKCTNWLEHGKPYNANRMTMNIDLHRKNNSETSQNLDVSPKEDENRDEAVINSDDNGTGSNEDVFVSENEEWVKVTARAIETMQSQVNHGIGYRDPEMAQNGFDAQCKCRAKSAPTVENGKVDRSEMAAKANNRRRNRSGSSLSSFSSVSSDSESGSSDIEEMSVCAVCRGDSIEYNIPQDGLGFDDAQTDKLSSGGSFLQNGLSPRQRKSSQSEEDFIHGSSPKLHPAQIKTQSQLLGSSHDSGYSETGLNISQENSVPLQPQHSPKPNLSSENVNKSDLLDHNKEVPLTQDSNSHKRFYHVFTEGELVSLMQKRVPQLSVLDSFYDHANWCVVAKKANI